MKANGTCDVVCFGSALLPIAERALATLNEAEPGVRFRVGGVLQNVRGQIATCTPWNTEELQSLLTAERKNRKCRQLIGILDDPLANNWFSNTAYGHEVAWITTHDWEFYSELPVTCFVAYDIVLNWVLMQVVKRAEDEAWLMGEVIHANETRGCISDLCAYKPDISRKIRSGFICPDCQKVFAQRLGSSALEMVQGLLRRISEACNPTEPNTSIRDFPVLERMRYRLEKVKRSATDELYRFSSGCEVIARMAEPTANVLGGY